MTFVSNMLSSKNKVIIIIIITETAIYKDQRGITKIYELWFLHFARRLILLNICMLFHQDILNGFQVIERALFYKGTATYKYYY